MPPKRKYLLFMLLENDNLNNTKFCSQTNAEKYKKTFSQRSKYLELWIQPLRNRYYSASFPRGGGVLPYDGLYEVCADPKGNIRVFQPFWS